MVVKRLGIKGTSVQNEDHSIQTKVIDSTIVLIIIEVITKVTAVEILVNPVTIMVTETIETRSTNQIIIEIIITEIVTKIKIETDIITKMIAHRRIKNLQIQSN